MIKFKFKNYSLITISSFLLFACSKGVPLNEDEVIVPENNSTNVSTGNIRSDRTTNSYNLVPNQFNKIVYFDFDSFVVKEEYQRDLSNFASNNLNSQIKVEGHTDERGGREYNLALGQKRAEAVKQSLTLLGLNGNQIEAVSFGKEKPVALGQTEEDYSQNRRAEIK